MSGACGTCDSCGTGKWGRMGVDMGKWDYTVALAGNPNTGKSTIFNALTGLRQHTGNWPGKTVTRAEGGFRYADAGFKLVDLPGTYSLLSATPDEEVARDFILFGRPDVTVVVADASRLERNLNLVLQVLQITDRAVLCLNLMDEARASGLELDFRGLARDLGVPVVPCAARQMEGIPELLKVISDVATGAISSQPKKLELKNPELASAIATITKELDIRYPDLPQKTWIAIRLLEGDRSIIDAVQDGSLAQLVADQQKPIPALSS